MILELLHDTPNKLDVSIPVSHPVTDAAYTYDGVALRNVNANCWCKKTDKIRVYGCRNTGSVLLQHRCREQMSRNARINCISEIENSPEPKMFRGTTTTLLENAETVP
jgi:hypothetical protein